MTESDRTGLLALGIDGGASTLNWSLATPDGKMLHGVSQGANPQLLGLEPYAQRLVELTRAVLHEHGFSLEQPLTLGLGLSGVDRPAEKKRLTEAFAQACPALCGFWVGNDALAALRQGAGRLEGIILIAGSGSICLSVAPDGHIHRFGGWGLTLGDEGSAAWIGLRALNAVTHMADGLTASTPLLPALLDELRLETAQALIPWCAALDPSEFKRRVAALAPVVIELSRCGEKVSRQIVTSALDHLAALVTAAQSRQTASRPLDRQAPPAEIKLVCAGGLLQHEDSLFDDLKALLEQRRDGELVILRLRGPASLGALALGREPPVARKSA